MRVIGIAVGMACLLMACGPSQSALSGDSFPGSADAEESTGSESVSYGKAEGRVIKTSGGARVIKTSSGASVDQDMLAQAPAASPLPEGELASQERSPSPSPTATDATPPGPLLIYEAQLYLAVFKVEENLKTVAAMAQETGGFLAQQTTTMIVIRVPAAKFTDAVARIEAMGDVLQRQVQALDVSEEFRDVDIRLRNALQVRDRLAALLARVEKVEESLKIERELERLTRDIERLKGRMRFLQDRITYSTITVSFQPKEREQIGNQLFRLPFDWLDSLGLKRLLSL